MAKSSFPYILGAKNVEIFTLVQTMVGRKWTKYAFSWTEELYGSLSPLQRVKRSV